MASKSLIEFIDAALFCTSPFGLSYTDPDQKLLVREHLLSLFQDFPSLISSFDTFIHNDGTTVNLLNATGNLQISPSTPAVPITIWLHENYPKLAPIVFVSSNSTYRIQNDHPFVDPSGATTSPYLQSWSHPRSNLSGLVHNLINLFSLIHPFSISSYPSVSSHPSVFSKMEAMDRLSYYLHSDMAAMRAAIEEELEGLSSLQSEMIKRVDMALSLVMALEHEESSLKRKVIQLREQADVLTNWLRVNDHHHHQVNVLGDDEMEDPFEGVDEKSKLVLDCFAADCALEDVFYELDKAVEQGAVSFEMYIKQVRALAREQFLHRVKAENLRAPACDCVFSSVPSHQLSSDLYVLDRPKHLKAHHTVLYTSSDIKRSDELNKMFNIFTTDPTQHTLAQPLLPSTFSSQHNSGSLRSGFNST